MSSRNRWINRLAKRSAVVLAAAAATASFTGSLWAQLNGTWTFTVGGTTWSNTNAWLFGNPAPSNGVNTDSTANFTAVDVGLLGPFQFPIDMDVSVTLAQLNFSDTGTGTPGGWTLWDSTGGGTRLPSILTLARNTLTQPELQVNTLSYDVASNRGYVGI
jgi:hypothetical protein